MSKSAEVGFNSLKFADMNEGNSIRDLNEYEGNSKLRPTLGIFLGISLENFKEL